MTDHKESPAEIAHPYGSVEVTYGNGFSDLVQLEIRCHANRIGNTFPLDLLLEVDEMRILVKQRPGILRRLAEPLCAPGEDITLRVRLKHCYVRYSGGDTHLSVVKQTKYRSALEIGGFTGKQSTRESAATSSATSLGLQVSVTGSLRPKLDPRASGAISRDSKGTRNVERSITLSQDIYQVEAVPKGWRIGDTIHGDPVKSGGFLYGPYFSKPEDSFPNTCVVEFDIGHRQGAMTFDVTTTDGLHVERLNRPAYPSDTDAAHEAMRDKIAAICIERHHQFSADELLLSTARLVAYAASDEQPHEDER